MLDLRSLEAPPYHESDISALSMYYALPLCFTLLSSHTPSNWVLVTLCPPL